MGIALPTKRWASTKVNSTTMTLRLSASPKPKSVMLSCPALGEDDCYLCCEWAKHEFSWNAKQSIAQGNAMATNCLAQVRHRLETDAWCWGKTREAGLVCRSRRLLADGGLGGMKRMASPPAPLLTTKSVIRRGVAEAKQGGVGKQRIKQLFQRESLSESPKLLLRTECVASRLVLFSPARGRQKVWLSPAAALDPHTT